jgi:aspartate racemase
MRHEPINRREVIGILGGIGPAATAHIFSQLIKTFQTNGAVLDNDFPAILVHSLNIPGTQPTGVHSHPDLVRSLQAAVSQLITSGATILGVACNSLHGKFANIGIPSNIKLLDMIQLTVDAARDRSWRRVGICASRSTRSEQLFNNAFSEYEITTIDLPEELQCALDSAILSVMGNKDITNASNILKTTIDTLLHMGADGVIVGCTELSMIAPVDYRVLDSAELLVAALHSNSSIIK